MIKTVLLLLLLSTSFSMASAVTLKVGVLAPEGTSWAVTLKKMVKEIKKATNNEVKFRIYYGGSQGDEPNVLRKIRIGQLHGGIFTGKTLGDINGDVRVMEIPFTFGHNTKKAWKALKYMRPYFDKQFLNKKFVNLGFFEIGTVYLTSKKEIKNIKNLNGLKIWAWEGDPLVKALIESMNLVSIPLPLPDVLSSLSTGVIEAAYAPALGIIALQWNTKVKYLLDYPLSYSVGAFLINQRYWKKISPKNRDIINSISKKYFEEITSGNSRENIESLDVLKSMNVKFVKFPAPDYKNLIPLRAKIISKLKGSLFSEEAYRKLSIYIK